MRPDLRRDHAVTTRDHYDVTIRIAEPHFAMIRPRVHVRFQHDLRAQFAGLVHGRIEIIHLEPEQHSVPHGRCIGVHKIGMIFLVPGMELKDQLAGAEYPVIEVAMRVVRK